MPTKRRTRSAGCGAAKCGVGSAECGFQRSKAQGEGRKPKVHRRSTARPAAADYHSRFLCVGFALALAVTGCAGPRPLKGGQAVVTRTAGGAVQQTLSQSENPAQATKQERESVKVRTFVVPAGSRMQASGRDAFHSVRDIAFSSDSARDAVGSVPTIQGIRAREDARPPSSSLAPLASSLVLSAPMPVTEREETRERTELGAAQRDMAREVGAKLASLKGIVWVGVGLFVFGLASLVYPPLKAVIGSVTTSAALMLGGVALMVLPSLVVGNELLILGVVAVVVGAYFLAHRHGELRGRLRTTDF
jgi:hypothetical protein